MGKSFPSEHALDRLTFVGLAGGTHSVIHLQFTLQRVDEFPAFTELLLQERDLMLQPEDKQMRVNAIESSPSLTCQCCHQPVGFLLAGLPLLPQDVDLLSLLLTVSLQAPQLLLPLLCLQLGLFEASASCEHRLT